MLFSMFLVSVCSVLTLVAVFLFAGLNYTNKMMNHMHNTGVFGTVWVISMVVLVFATGGVWCFVLPTVCGGVSYGWAPFMWWFFIVGHTQAIHWLTYVIVMRRINRY